MKVHYLVVIDVDPMHAFDPTAQVQDIKHALAPYFPKPQPEVTAALDPWSLMAEGNKNELIKLAYKAIRHGFGDHPENLTDMDKLAGSIAKRMVGELWARRKK